MKKLLAGILIGAAALASAYSSVIVGPVYDPFGRVITNTITFVLQTPTVQSTNFFSRARLGVSVGTNGQFSVTLAPGNWTAQIGPLGDIVGFPVPNDTNTYPLASLLSSGAIFVNRTSAFLVATNNFSDVPATAQARANLQAAGLSDTNTFTGTNTFTNTTTLMRTVLYPKNIYSGVGTVSGTINSHVFTGTTGAFAGLLPGDNIAPGGGEQYYITVVDSPTMIHTWEALVTSHTNSTYIVYPNEVVMEDINGRNIGAIGGDGSISVQTPTVANSGAFYIASGTNTFRMSTQSAPDGGVMLIIGTPQQSTIFCLNANAPYNSFRVLLDGSASFKGVLTNADGSALTIGSPVVSQSTVQVQSGGVMHSGTGSPNGAVVGSVGDTYTRTDGGTGTTLYVKETGSASNTGWVAK